MHQVLACRGGAEQEHRDVASSARRYTWTLRSGVSISSSPTWSPTARSPSANASGGTWLPFVKSASGLPDARIRRSTSAAPGWT